MSRSKIKQQLVYFPKNIRKNIIHRDLQQQQRPKTSSHRRYFASRGYKQLPQKVSIQKMESRPLATLQINNMKYINQGFCPERKNIINFLQSCHVENCRQNKIKNAARQGKIKLIQNNQNQQNQMQKFVDALVDSNYFFQKIQRTMIQSLVLIGIQKKYQKGQKIQLNRKMIGFVLYGRIKLHLQKDYSYIATRGDTLGEHELYGVNDRIFKIKILEDSAVLWVAIPNFQVLRQESIREGFRLQFNKMETQLRLSFIKKKMLK